MGRSPPQANRRQHLALLLLVLLLLPMVGHGEPKQRLARAGRTTGAP